MEKEKLLDIIEKDYGFKKELIKNPVQRGFWFVQFEVNGIKYNGSIPFHGALPQLKAGGHTTDYYNENGVPVEDWYYNKFIKGKKARLRHCVDEETGEWEDTGIEFKDQKQAEEYMSNLDENDLPYYMYEMIQEGDRK